MKMNEKENPGWRAMEIARLWREHEEYKLPKFKKVLEDLSERKENGEEMSQEDERRLAVFPIEIAEIENRMKNGYPEGAGLGVMDLKIPDKFVFNVEQRSHEEKQAEWHKKNLSGGIELSSVFSIQDLKMAHVKKEEILHRLDPDRAIPEGYTAQYKPGVTRERWY